MRDAIAAATARGAESVVCTFDPHTRQVLRPQHSPELLQTLEQRISAIESLGVDVTVVIPFDTGIAATGRRAFVDDFLFGELNVGSLHVSKGFSFGRGRSGKTEYLEERASELDFEVIRVEARELESEQVSSTRIREAVRAGDIESARHLLGRPFAIRGSVVPGRGRGRELGAPTANLVPENGCLPPPGVYAGFVPAQGACLAAVMNIGHRPTFEPDGSLSFEVHLLDFDGDLYEQHLDFDFEARLRDERKFGSTADLAEQIRADVEEARRRLGAEIS